MAGRVVRIWSFVEEYLEVEFRQFYGREIVPAVKTEKSSNPLRVEWMLNKRGVLEGRQNLVAAWKHV